MPNYYIRYDESAKINYCFLFALYRIAETNKKEHLKNIIKYNSLSELQKRMQENCKYRISLSTISRELNKDTYNCYFSKSKEKKEILLLNNFKREFAVSNKFVVLTDKELAFLLEHKDNKLIRYYMYLKYYCSYSKSKSIDTTAKQILLAIGYSANCGNGLYDLCRYNKLLKENGFISIETVRDQSGRSRNFYNIINQNA